MQRHELLIDAPREHVWRTMLDARAYEDWSSAFCAGSRYKGSWTQGAVLRFLDPHGDGLVAVVVEHRPAERVRLRFEARIVGGVEDRRSASARAWIGAVECYAFVDADASGESTVVAVEVDPPPAHAPGMADAWPRALRRLKGLCEASR
jgi:uncharacterized protein YndB with AHSA1/START domain